MYVPDWFRTVIDVDGAWCRLCGWSGDVEGIRDTWDKTTTWTCPNCTHEEEEKVT